MQKTRQNAVIHIPLLVFIQWTSIAVIGLNAVALGSISGDQGLLDMKSGSQDYLLLVLGGLSLLSSSFLICLYLHTYFHLINNERSAPSRTILTAELAAGILLVALWASGTWVIMSSYHTSSPCHFVESEYAHVEQQACDMLGWTIILACINITGWAFVILVTLFTLIQTSFQQSPATVCTVESPTLNYPYSEKMPSLPSYSSQKQLIAEPEPTACTRTSSLRPTKSWCSESWSEDNDERSSFEPVPLDDLPHIQVGMSRMDLTFAARSYEEIKL